jgi:hypothetical protein
MIASYRYSFTLLTLDGVDDSYEPLYVLRDADRL